MTTENLEHLVYTVKEAGRLLRLSRGTTYEAIRRGQIGSIRVGRRLLIPRVAIENLLRQGTTGNDGGL